MDLERPIRNRSSADFQVCCIAGFQTRQPHAVDTPRRFGNRRYSRFGTLRYDKVLPSPQTLCSHNFMQSNANEHEQGETRISRISHQL